MLPCAADRFDEMLVRLFTVWVKRLETAPSSERWMFTVFIALSSAEIAAIALEGLSRVKLDDKLVEGLAGTVCEDDDPEDEDELEFVVLVENS